jgi:hypothetical protein
MRQRTLQPGKEMLAHGKKSAMLKDSAAKQEEKRHAY